MVLELVKFYKQRVIKVVEKVMEKDGGKKEKKLRKKKPQGPPPGTAVGVRGRLQVRVSGGFPGGKLT